MYLLTGMAFQVGLPVGFSLIQAGLLLHVARALNSHCFPYHRG